jgi:peroxiredoxin
MSTTMTAELDAVPEDDTEVAVEPPTRGSRSGLVTLIILVVTGAAILAAAYLSTPAKGNPTGNGNFTPVSIDGQPIGAAPAVGVAAPDFMTATTNGTPLRLSDYRGKPIWLTFGASWCQPCRAENADLQAAYAANKDNITVIQVYMSEEASTVADYTGRVGIAYLTVPDPLERLANLYRIYGIPSHFFIDAQGVLRQIKIGTLDQTAMQAAIDQVRQ